MEGVHYELHSEKQFWGELDDILETPAQDVDPGGIESAVRTYIAFAAAFRGM
jgi:hypothetical protein